MRHVFVCPMNDTIEIAAVELQGEHRLSGGLTFDSYRPSAKPVYPYVPAYFQDYKRQRAPLRAFLRENLYGFRPKSYLLLLHDDATDLEAHALSELLIGCGAKETLMEYRAFLLAEEEAYLAVTGSKRAVTVTLVRSGEEETERIFLPINEAGLDAVQEAIAELDPEGKLPVYRFGVPETLYPVGAPVHAGDIVRHFVKML